MAALLEALMAVGSMALVNAARRAALSMAGLALCAALLVVSFAFFTLAAYRALEQAVGVIQAPLAIGGAYLVTALAGLLMAQSRR